MGTVFYLPGIFGSELNYQLPPSSKYWVDEKRLQNTLLGDLRLDGTVGINPAAGVQALAPGQPLDSHYGRAVNEMRADLKDTAFSDVVGYGYDWRYSIVYSAGFLASAIGRKATPTNPCVLVGHSLGGLVARMAYYQLRTAGKANLVKRVICIGTPHFGSARICRVLNGDFDEGFGWVFKSFLLKAFPGASVLLPVVQQALISNVGTWPAFMEMLPAITNDGSLADLMRKLAYKPETYSGGGTLWKALMDNAKDATRPLLSDLVSVPPGKKLVCIVGTGYPTPYITEPQVIFTPAGPVIPAQPLPIAMDGPGDGTVSESSAYVPGSELITLECPHSALPAFLAGGNLLNQLILDNFDESDVTPPPPQRPPQQQAPAYVGPPLEPLPPPEPPPPPVRSLTTGRGRPVRR